MELDFIKQLILALIESQLATLDDAKKQIDDKRIDLEKSLLELNGYGVEVGRQIHELEELKKKYLGGSLHATKIKFYEIVDNNFGKEITMANIELKQTKKIGFRAFDDGGNIVSVENVTVSVGDAAMGEAKFEEGIIKVTGLGPAGESILSFNCDGKMGEGEKLLHAELPLTFLPGDAVKVELFEIVEEVPAPTPAE